MCEDADAFGVERFLVEDDRTVVVYAVAGEAGLGIAEVVEPGVSP